MSTRQRNVSAYPGGMSDFHSCLLETLDKSFGVRMTNGLDISFMLLPIAPPAIVPTDRNLHITSIMDVFTAMRERHTKFMRISPPVKNETREIHENPQEEDSPFLRTHSFVIAAMHIVDPAIRLIPGPEREQCVQRFVERATPLLISEPMGVVKRYRKATGDKSVSAEAMCSTLYYSAELLQDHRVNNIIIFYISCALKHTIVVTSQSPDATSTGQSTDATSSDATRTYPPNASVNDDAILVTRGERGRFSLHAMCRARTSLAEVFVFLANEWGGRNPGSNPLKMRSNELQRVFKDQMGITDSKQLECLRAEYGLEKSDEAVSKKNLFTKDVMAPLLAAMMAQKQV
jgi:hypothetical protein